MVPVNPGVQPVVYRSVGLLQAGSKTDNVFFKTILKHNYIFGIFPKDAQEGLNVEGHFAEITWLNPMFYPLGTTKS